MTATSEALDARVRFAITHKRLVEVCYKGSPRVAEPHDYGVQKGVERLFVYQLRSPTRSSRQPVTGWRLLDVPKIESCVVLDETFTGSRGRADQRHLKWDTLYARVC